MKNFKMMMALGFSVLMLGACGASTPATTTAATAANTCGVGSGYTQYGCLPQAGCQVGQALYNGTCIATSVPTNGGITCAAGQVNTTQYACVYTGNCQTGQALVNNTCTPVTIVTNTNPGYNPNNGGYNNGGSCQGGFYNVVGYGCLPQGPCYSNQVFYMNQCVPLTSYNSGGGGFSFHFGW
jgi:hypothetical protein